MFITKDKMKEWDRLKKRSDFLRVQSAGKKWVSRGVIMQVAPNDIGLSRFGLTVTKRVSKSAVVRNRIKRRLRAAAYDIFPLYAQKNIDIVLIGRVETEKRDYGDLQNDLKYCLKKLGYLKEE